MSFALPLVEEEEKLYKHIDKLWKQFSEHQPKFLPTHFLNTAYILQDKFQIIPEVHFIGNYLAHYLGHLKPNDTTATMDTIDVIQLKVLLGWSYKNIINNLHRVQSLLVHMDILERIWRKYQKETLGLCYTVGFDQAFKIKNTLQIVYSWQIYMKSKIKNYNRKLLLVFRLFHSQNYPQLIPKLQWGESNDWSKGLDTLVLGTGRERYEETIQEILDDEPDLRIKERYGCALDLKSVVRYYDFVKFKLDMN